MPAASCLRDMASSCEVHACAAALARSLGARLTGPVDLTGALSGVSIASPRVRGMPFCVAPECFLAQGLFVSGVTFDRVAGCARRCHSGIHFAVSRPFYDAGRAACKTACRALGWHGREGVVIWTDACIRIGEIAADGFAPLFQQVVGSEQAEKAVLQAMFLAYLAPSDYVLGACAWRA